MLLTVKKTAAVLCGAALACAGCSWLPSVGPDYREPALEHAEFILPDAGYPTTNLTAVGEYESASGASDLRAPLTTNEISRWWRRFDDPVLVDLVDSALRNNLSFQMARERLTAARWRLLGSYAAFLPSVAAKAGFTRSQKGPNTPSMDGTGRSSHLDVFSGGFDATWEIDLFGGSRRATEAARAEAEAAEWDLADAWVSLTSEVGLHYIALRTTQKRIETSLTNLVLQTETYEILKARFSSGIGDELAVSQSKYVVDQTRAGIPTLLAQEEAALNALAILTGEAPGGRHGQLKDMPRREWLLAPEKLESMPLDLLRGRPDVRRAERRFAAQVAHVGVATSRWFPKLYINGSLGLEARHANKLLKRDALYGSLGPSVSWPIFQGGNVYANIKAEEAEMNEARLNYELSLLNAYADVRNVYASYTQEYHRLQSLEGAVRAAGDAVSIAQDLYKNGLRDFTAVIDAQRSLLSLQEQLVVSRGEITREMIALYKSLGGGFGLSDGE
jgi:NodT family efflux transporter outer membrane factor (OMF) lipoprotein